MADKRVLQWGGFAGIAAAAMIVLSIITGVFAPPLFVSAGSNACGPACYVDAALPGFPSVKAALLVENVLYFAAVTFLVIFFLGLYRALAEGKGLAPAMSGTGLALLGLAMEFTGALPTVAFAHLSEAYQTATPQDQTTLILASHAVQAIFNTTDTVGGILLALGFLLFGLAMLHNQTSFGRKFGLPTIALSIVALSGISVVSIVTDNPNDPFFVILLLVLPLVVGVNLYRLSKSVPE